MAELELTKERHDELAALLNDEQRLDAEYPSVAEYLDMRLRLPGTGDDRADAAFDLRFVHYMVDSHSWTVNPYWDIVGPSVSEFEGRRVVNGGHHEGSARLALAQTILQATYAYAIPSPETISWMSRFCGDRPIVELGAGRGYWAAQLSREGLVIDAYELEPPDTTDNVSFPRGKGRQVNVWYPVGKLADARLDARPDHVLFLCWPPGWGDTMASDALTTFELASGDRLIYVGEPKGGKTGNDGFFDALSARWELESVDSSFVSWWNLTDVAQGWVRR
jgi:hypothetical protein